MITLTYSVFNAFDGKTAGKVNRFLVLLEIAMYAHGKYSYMWKVPNNRFCMCCKVPFVHDEYRYRSVDRETFVCVDCALEMVGADNFVVPEVLLAEER